MSDLRTQYHRAFTEKANASIIAEPPKAPALLLFFGEIALGTSESVLRKLRQQLHVANQDAVIAGCFASAQGAAEVKSRGEEQGLPCCEVLPDTAQRPFGEFARAWLAEHEEEASAFARKLLHRVTEKATAKNMNIADIYLIVGNDGGACELWPAVSAMLAEIAGNGTVLRIHLMWLYRELCPMRRDGEMCRLMRLLVDSIPLGAAGGTSPLNSAEAKDVLGSDFPLTLFKDVCLISDRDGNNLCSQRVWQRSVTAMAAYVLFNLYGTSPAAAIVNCGSIDMIYPDEYWSAGFQLSALRALRQQLEGYESLPVPPFMQLLAKQPAWQRDTPFEELTANDLMALISRALPTVQDLYVMPLNPDLKLGDLRRIGTYQELAGFLYGARFEGFFQDVLTGESVRDLTDLLWLALEQAMRAFAASHGPAAVHALARREAGRKSLTATFAALRTEIGERNAEHRAVATTLARRPLASLADRRTELIRTHGAQRIEQLRRDVAVQVLDELMTRLEQAAPAWQAERDGFDKAMTSAAHTLEEVFYDVKDVAYYAHLLDAGKRGQMFAFPSGHPNMLEIPSLGSHYAKRGQREAERSIMRILMQINLSQNQFLQLSLSEAIEALSYPQGYQDLCFALKDRCVRTISSNASFTTRDFWIAPDAENWAFEPNRNAGGHIVELIRIFCPAAEAGGIFRETSYLAGIMNANASRRQDTSPMDMDAVREDENANEEAEETVSSDDVAFIPDGPLTTVFNNNRTLIRFPWPEGASSVTLSWNGEQRYGEPPKITELVVNHGQYKNDGGASVPCRLQGPLEMTTVWYMDNTRYSRTNRLLGDRDYISYHVQGARGQDKRPCLSVEIACLNRELPFHKYLVLVKRSPDGRAVRYQLPPAMGAKVLIGDLGVEGADKLEIQCREKVWDGYLKVEPR